MFILREKDVHSVVFPTETSYKWPNSIGDNRGSITIRKTLPYLKTLYTKNSLRDMFNSGNFDYQQYAFPKIYHGIIKRECLDENLKGIF